MRKNCVYAIFVVTLRREISINELNIHNYEKDFTFCSGVLQRHRNGG